MSEVLVDYAKKFHVGRSNFSEKNKLKKNQLN